GRREEALAPAQEAVGLYRELAARQPEAFRPDLAMSLNTLANRLSELGRREEALAPAQEAVAALAPHFLALPPAFAPWMRSMVGTYLGVCRALGREPDAALLGPALEALEGLAGEGQGTP
ncbi:MAG: tetratricopeptide repeat protein, partial [Chloroflexi bacterium]|nr:tetratricopeptide repeat protein [Chloroflexota bacterium]